MAVLVLLGAGGAAAELLEDVQFSRPEPDEPPVSESDRMHFTPPRAEHAPELDGRLEEGLWEAEAAFLGSFRLGLSATPARHAREAWAAWDQEALYVAVRLEREPGTELRVLTHEPDDGAIWEDDEIEMFLDPLLTGTHYCQLILNSEGVLYDAEHRLVEVPDPGAAEPGATRLERRTDLTWSSDLERAVSIEDTHWTVEMALPLASIGLTGAPAGHQLGFNLTSADWDTEEYTTLSPVSDWHDPRQFGLLALGPPRVRVKELDLSGVGQGRNLLRLELEHLRGPTGDFLLTMTFEAAGQWLQRERAFAMAEGDLARVGLVFDVQADSGPWNARVQVLGPERRPVYVSRRTGVLPGPMRVRLASRASFADGPAVPMVVRLGVGRLTARRLSLRARLLAPGGEVVAEQAIGAVEGPVMAAVMPVTDLAPGIYALQMDALSDDRVVASGSDALRVAASPFEET
ncbi:MAG: carbohydrate-binding family 9-like protein [Armatimonadota bacterium]|nr:carbohydrate-binding family 9-like protein [Armatimonadota bacterium]